jgi:hypothetical protein
MAIACETVTYCIDALEGADRLVAIAEALRRLAARAAEETRKSPRSNPPKNQVTT